MMRIGSMSIARAAHLLIGVAFGFLTLLGTSCKTAERSEGAFHEVLPDEVQAEISSQIHHFFGSGPFRGIPLLDQKADWNNAQRWPEDFSFQGHDFKPRYGTFGSDWFGGPDSRDVIQAKTGYYIKYKVELPAPLWWHSFHCYWSRHGYVKEKGITWGHKSVFSLQFYPSGKLFKFDRDQTQGRYRIDVYDLTGRKIGSNENHSRYTWDGKEITAESFRENLNEIWMQYFPPEG